MSEGAEPLALVIGIGNPDRGDDGFAAAVIGRLRGRLPAGVSLIARRGDLLELLNDWNGFDAVILVDAAAPTTQPGRVHRLDLAAGPLPVDWSPSSTHALGLGETVELARNLGRLPRRLVLYLVEGKKFDVGDPLSPAVADAVDAVAESILTEVSAFLTVVQLYCGVANA